MSGTGLLLAIVIPALAIVGFGGWIGAAHFADRHPPKRHERPEPLKTEVRGGAFQATGGRQVMPRRDATPPEAERYESGEAD